MSRHIKHIICIATLLALPLLFVKARWATQPVGAQAQTAAAERQARGKRRSNAPTVPAAHHAQTAAPQVKTTEQRYKNIQVFKGLPASELQSMMTFMASSLGVSCNHCHVGGGAFEKDDKPTKQTARRMIQMTRSINDANFSGITVVTCNTCHRGSTRPMPVPALISNAAPGAGAGAAAATTDASPPSAEQVLDKYVEAIGGKAALARVSTRIVKGSRVNADGSAIPTEVYQKAPDKVLTVVTYPNVSFFAAFNGTDGWARDSHGAGEITKELLILTKRDSEFFFGTRFAQLYTGMTLAGKQKVGEQEAYVVNATSSDGGTESLFFDAKTWLLLQRNVEVKTPLGSYPFQIKYEDYREVDGIKLPFVLHWSRPGLQWSRKITEVKHNVPIEDSKFMPPPVQN